MDDIEVVIKIPKEKYNAIKGDLYNTFPAEMKEWGLEAIRNGISLQQEPCKDCISRKDTLTEFKRVYFDNDTVIRCAELILGGMPPVTPQSKIGRWIPMGYNGYADGNPVYDWWECSECGWEHAGDEETLTPYCPNCGAKMEEEE